MPKSRQRGRENYSIGARIYAMAANMLQDVDGEEWTARGLSKGDVMLARAFGSIHLRIQQHRTRPEAHPRQGDGETRLQKA